MRNGRRRKLVNDYYMKCGRGLDAKYKEERERGTVWLKQGTKRGEGGGTVLPFSGTRNEFDLILIGIGLLSLLLS